MSDEHLRDLERRAAAGDGEAKLELVCAKAAAGLSGPRYLVDLVEDAGFGNLDRSYYSAGLRAVFKAADVKATVRTERYSFADDVVVTYLTRSAQERTRRSVLVPSPYLSSDGRESLCVKRREDDSTPDAVKPEGPKLHPEWHEAFVRGVKAVLDKERGLAPDREYAVGDVVRFRVIGSRRRYVVSWVARGRGTMLLLSALSGALKGSSAQADAQDVLLDDDQSVEFSGAEADVLRERHEHRSRQ